MAGAWVMLFVIVTVSSVEQAFLEADQWFVSLTSQLQATSYCYNMKRLLSHLGCFTAEYHSVNSESCPCNDHANTLQKTTV